MFFRLEDDDLDGGDDGDDVDENDGGEKEDDEATERWREQAMEKNIITSDGSIRDNAFTQKLIRNKYI